MTPRLRGPRAAASLLSLIGVTALSACTTTVGPALSSGPAAEAPAPVAAPAPAVVAAAPAPAPAPVAAPVAAPAPAAAAPRPAAPPPPAGPPLSARASDPVRMGWMQGFPPPPDKRVQFADGSSSQFPRTRWSFSHLRELAPTANIWRGEGQTSRLPRAERDDLDGVSFKVLGKDQTLTWGEAFDANYTDGVLVLHRGRIIYERYAGALKPERPHIAWSVTKSFFGTIGAELVARGVIDDKALVSKYIPELKDSAFGDATVRQVLDMTTGLKYSENYADPNAEIYSHVRAGGLVPRPPGYAGPKTFYEFLATVRKEGEHGQAFAYKTVNSDVLGWIIARATNKSVGENLQEMIWGKLGAEQDAYMVVDSIGTEFAGGGFNTTLRDLARFGEVMRLNGRFNGQQIISPAVVADIRRGASQSDFAKAGYKTLPGWSYRNMWWVTHNDHQAFSARGVYGQLIYVDPKAEMVIVRFASNPIAANGFIDPTSLPAYEALAEHLIANPVPRGRRVAPRAATDPAATAAPAAPTR